MAKGEEVRGYDKRKIPVKLRESCLPGIEHDVNARWVYDGEGKLDEEKTLTQRINAALDYSALIRDCDGLFYYRTFNGDNTMEYIQWGGRRLKPIDDGTDYISKTEFAAMYLGVKEEMIEKWIEYGWLNPVYASEVPLFNLRELNMVRDRIKEGKRMHNKNKNKKKGNKKPKKTSSVGYQLVGMGNV